MRECAYIFLTDVRSLWLDSYLKVWLRVQFLHAIILDFWAGFLAVNQYFPSLLICLQFLQSAAGIAHVTTSKIIVQFILALGRPPLQELHARIAHATKL